MLKINLDLQNAITLCNSHYTQKMTFDQDYQERLFLIQTNLQSTSIYHPKFD